MQYKKEDVRQRIIDAAKREYLENGYKGGNIKNIAELAGVPVGNLYRYFAGKSGLLDAIVSPVYAEIPHIIEMLASLHTSQNIPLEEITPIITDNTLHVFDKYGTELLILVDRCEKTKYADFFERISNIIASLVFKYYPSEVTQEQDELIHITSRAFLNAVFDIFRRNYDYEKTQGLVSKLILFYFLKINERI